MKLSTKTILTSFATIVLLTATAAVAQWVGPTNPAPGGTSVQRFLDTSSVPQAKYAAFGATGLHVSGNPGTPAAGMAVDITGPASFDSLVTANARVLQIDQTQNATQPICANPQTGRLGLCAAFAITFNASPSSVDEGTTTTLNWSVPSATSCTGTGPGFSTNNAAAGSDVSAVLNATSTFTLTCVNAQGATQSRTITVQANPIAIGNGVQ
jgi:hypothetical protein